MLTVERDECRHFYKLWQFLHSLFIYLLEFETRRPYRVAKYEEMRKIYLWHYDASLQDIYLLTRLYTFQMQKLMIRKANKPKC